MTLTLTGLAASCSAATPGASPPLGEARQATHTPAHQGIAHYVCNLVGDVDRFYPVGDPRRLTPGQTTTRFGIDNTDLGFPVVQGERIWFFFGDHRVAAGLGGDGDPLGYTNNLTLDDDEKCPTMKFLASGISDAAVRLDGNLLDGFQVPTGVVFDEENQRFIGHFMLDASPATPNDRPTDNTG